MTVPFIFYPDTKILAADVNANFSDLDGKVGGASTGFFSSIAAASVQYLGPTINTVYLAGYYSAGDGGGGQYDYVVSSPGHSASFQNNGRWFELKTTYPPTAKQFGAVANGADARAAILSALTYANECVIDNDTFNFTGEFLLPAGKTLTGAGANSTIIQASTGSNNATSVVRSSFADGTTIRGLILNGNLNARETSGELVAGYTWSSRTTNSSNCLIEQCHSVDCGDTDADFAARGGNGGGFLIEYTVSGTSDVQYNEVLQCTANNPKAGFHCRIASDFTGYGPGDLPYFAQYNKITDVTGRGVRKNALEMAGPNVRHNIATRVFAINCVGQGGQECDFGANNNLFVECKNIFENGFVFTRSYDGFSSRSSDNGDGHLKFTYDNTWIDCECVGGTTSGAFYYRAFAEIGSSKRARFIRPKFLGFTRGVGVSTQRIIGHYVEATMEQFDGSEIIDMNFQDVDCMNRITGTAGILALTYSGGYCSSESNAYTSPTSTMSIETVTIEGIRFDCPIMTINPGTVSIGGVEELMFIRRNHFRLTAAGTAVITTPKLANSGIFIEGNFFDIPDGSGGSSVAITKDPNCYMVEGGNAYRTRAPGGAIGGTSGRVHCRSDGIVLGNVINAGRPGVSRVRIVGDTAPTTGVWNRGDEFILQNSNPSASNGSINTTAGGAHFAANADNGP